jgi:hypothetical protein
MWPWPSQLFFAVCYSHGAWLGLRQVLCAMYSEGFALWHPPALSQPAFSSTPTAGVPTSPCALLPEFRRVSANPTGGDKASCAGKRVLHETVGWSVSILTAISLLRPCETGERPDRSPRTCCFCSFCALLVPSAPFHLVPNPVTPRLSEKSFHLALAGEHGEVPDTPEPQEASPLRRCAFGQPLQELSISASFNPKTCVARWGQDGQCFREHLWRGSERLPVQNTHESFGRTHQPLHLRAQPAEEVVQRPTVQRASRE